MSALNATFRGRLAESTINRYSIVAAGAAAMSAIAATGPTQKLLGTSDELNHVAGEMVDVALGPLPIVTLGGTVAAGDPLTADATGRAVVATTAGQRLIGFAEIAGVAGDEIPYLRSLGVL